MDLLDSFSGFVVDAAYKDMKNIQQFYDDKRTFNIVGKSSRMVVYDPDKIRDVEFDLSVIESTSTPAYRQIANDFLVQIWQAGQITLQQMLEAGDFPFGDALLQSLQAQQAQLAQGQQPGGISPDLAQQVQQSADMNAVSEAYDAIKPNTPDELVGR